MIQVQFPDASVKEYPDQATAMEVAQSIGSRLAGAVVAAEVDGQVGDAMRPLAELSPSRPIPLRAGAGSSHLFKACAVSVCAAVGRSLPLTRRFSTLGVCR